MVLDLIKKMFLELDEDELLVSLALFQIRKYFNYFIFTNMHEYLIADNVAR